jgi:hypothetical protein
MSAADTEGIPGQFKRGVPRLYIWGGFYFRGRRHFKAFYWAGGWDEGKGFPDR